MPSVCLYLKAHQPLRVKNYRVFDVGADHNYFNDAGETDLNNKKVFMKVVEKSFRPTNKMLLELLQSHPEFKVSFSLTGVLLEQLEEMAPDVIEDFRKIMATGRAEILGETYHHSLAFFYDVAEFEHQVNRHREILERLFDHTPKVLSNTELAYNNDLAQWADKAGYKGIVAEGWDKVLEWRSPNFVYRPSGTKDIKLLLKNYRLSDDIAFRFSEHSWEGWPLTAPKFAEWVNSYNGNGNTVNLFMDYETFGEHQWEVTGIFDFLRAMPHEVLKHPDNHFLLPSEVAETYDSVGELDIPHILTWADTDRDLTAWTGNKMQQSALEAIYAIGKDIMATGDSQLIEDWRKLQTSDHFYYMCTKWFADGDVHAYFSPYESPYDAFIAYMNVLQDVRHRLQRHKDTVNVPEKVVKVAKAASKKEKGKKSFLKELFNTSEAG